MPVDTSSYNTTPVNPLASMGQAVGIQNAINQNRLFDQTFAARKAIGQAYQGAIDPSSGQIDTNRLMQGVANNPDAAYMAGDVGQQALAQQTGQTDLQTKQVALARTHFANLASGFGSLAAKSDLSYKDFIGLAGDYISQGMITPQTAAQELSQLPQNATPQQLQQAAKNYQLRAMSGAEQLDKMYPTPQAINTGGQTQMVSSSAVTGQTNNVGAPFQNTPAPTMTDTGNAIKPTSGGVQVAPDIQKGIDPTTLSQPIQVYDPISKQYVTITRGQLLQMQGGAGAPVATPAPAVSNAPPPLGSGRYPALSQGPATDAATALGSPASVSGRPGMGVPAAPPLGAEAAANVMSSAAANQGVNLQQTADQVPQRKALLGNMEAALADFDSGPGRETWKTINAGTNRMFGINAQSIASTEDFAKLATQLAQSQFQSLGGTGTDAKLDSAMHTSPNLALSNLGNQQIIGLLKGNEDAINVKNQEWQSYLKKGGSPQDYGAFSTQFNKQFDPRVFQSTYMDPGQRQDLLKGMTSSEKSQFQNTYNYAVQRGWIPDPRATNGGQ